ncbi:hypothetical protein M885DRAFT_616248 [Pelagophyceae sp. CCMP2097]|nr:hypothetical protein M885DRAFT_616248 [Pelagophyceae sp. CCMP2097]|mmetsp:Transcript_10712/g.37039  ORF Transcript_10712/g.37039 Transcript_10712/m.37039 type:complete len:1358 (-) Transcript_10712:212-4285(-)
MENTPILYINLERSADRRVRMEKQFDDNGITNYHRVDAFDGKLLYADQKYLEQTVDLPPHKQSPGEIGCALSHVRAAVLGASLDVPWVLVMEDDIHLTFYDQWRTTIEEIVSLAPEGWQVLQLTINNVRVMRTLLGLGAPFVPWKKNHWSTGAYVINKQGCERCVEAYCNPAGSASQYRMPPNVQLVSDVLMFNGSGAYTFTRPLFDHEILESTIHQAHVESVHRQAAELGSYFYGRLDLIWCGGDDCRASACCKLGAAARPEHADRLEWWVRFHLRIGFRWLFLYAESDEARDRIAKKFRWLGRCVTVLSLQSSREEASAASDEALLSSDAISRARLAGASWLLRLADDELLYVLPGRSLRSVFDEARRGRASTDAVVGGAFNLRFDNVECQKRRSEDSRYNFFVKETLFKRRVDHCDGAPAAAADDRAFYDVPPTAAQLRRLPSSKAVGAVAFLAPSRGRSAVRLAEPDVVALDARAFGKADGADAARDMVSSRAFVLSYPHCHYESWKSELRAPAAPDAEATPFEAASRAVLASADEASALEFYARHTTLPAKALEEFDAADSAQHPPVVHVALPAGCVRADCGGAYSRLRTRGGDDGSALYQQQGGVHHLYRISTPFVAWMVGRTPYSSTAALVAHDLALRPHDVRAPWSAFDGRRWATVPSAHVRLDHLVVSGSGERFAVLRPAAVVDTLVDTLRALMLAPPRYTSQEFRPVDASADYATAPLSAVASVGAQACWAAHAPANGDALGVFLTAEQAEGALAAATKRAQRETYLQQVQDTGAVLVDLPAACGAAADACAGVYVPHELPGASGGRKLRVFRHEEGAHYLYFYEPFSAWMIGSRPGSGSAALIAYDGAERPELISDDAPWRVYDGRAWREVADVRIRALAEVPKTAPLQPQSDTSDSGQMGQPSARNLGSGPKTSDRTHCDLDDLPAYAWTPTGETTSPAVDQEAAPECGDPDGLPVFTAARKYLVYTCAGDRAVVPLWLRNGQRDFDVWVTYYGSGVEDKWRDCADCYRRRPGGKFENLQALVREAGVGDVFSKYDGVLVMDDDVVLDAPRINALFGVRANLGLDALQPAFERRGKVSHCITASQPANRVRLTNFIEMTCPLFSTRAISKFLERFDADLKGWGADWWFLTVVSDVARDQGVARQHPSTALAGVIGVCDAVTCINPTDDDKGGIREINVLQGREARRAVWEKIRLRENVDEWDHVEFGTVWLTPSGLPDDATCGAATPLRIRGCRNYEISPRPDVAAAAQAAQAAAQAAHASRAASQSAAAADAADASGAATPPRAPSPAVSPREASPHDANSDTLKSEGAKSEGGDTVCGPDEPDAGESESGTPPRSGSVGKLSE